MLAQQLRNRFGALFIGFAFCLFGDAFLDFIFPDLLLQHVNRVTHLLILVVEPEQALAQDRGRKDHDPSDDHKRS